jgi:hypothetical protein
MENCCNTDLGIFAHNKEINLGVKATQNGFHIIELIGPNFAGFTLRYYYFAGADIIIPQGKLNEDFFYKLKIKQPDNTYLETDTCPNYSLKTFVSTVFCSLCTDDEIIYY